MYITYSTLYLKFIVNSVMENTNGIEEIQKEEVLTTVNVALDSETFFVLALVLKYLDPPQHMSLLSPGLYVSQRSFWWLWGGLIQCPAICSA